MFSRNYPLARKSIISSSGTHAALSSRNQLLIVPLLRRRYSRNQDFLSTEDLTLFLEAEQGVSALHRSLARLPTDLRFSSSARAQMSKVTREKCTEIIQEFEPSTEAKLLCHLGIDGTPTRECHTTDLTMAFVFFAGFTNYLLSPECDIFNPHNRSVCQEMDHPLNHYFIASSHNT